MQALHNCISGHAPAHTFAPTWVSPRSRCSRRHCNPTEGRCTPAGGQKSRQLALPALCFLAPVLSASPLNPTAANAIPSVHVYYCIRPPARLRFRRRRASSTVALAVAPSTAVCGSASLLPLCQPLPQSAPSSLDDNPPLQSAIQQQGCHLLRTAAGTDGEGWQPVARSTAATLTPSTRSLAAFAATTRPYLQQHSAQDITSSHQVAHVHVQAAPAPVHDSPPLSPSVRPYSIHSQPSQHPSTPGSVAHSMHSQPLQHPLSSEAVAYRTERQSLHPLPTLSDVQSRSLHHPPSIKSVAHSIHSQPLHPMPFHEPECSPIHQIDIAVESVPAAACATAATCATAAAMAESVPAAACAAEATEATAATFATVAAAAESVPEAACATAANYATAAAAAAAAEGGAASTTAFAQNHSLHHAPGVPPAPVPVPPLQPLQDLLRSRAVSAGSRAAGLQTARLPRHIAIVMDGNYRWSLRRGLNLSQGHTAGADALTGLLRSCLDLGIPALTVYAFSCENWARDASEVAFLMSLFQRYVEEQVVAMTDAGIRLSVIGQRERLPPSLLRTVERAEAATSSCSTLHLTLAVSYGGRQDITAAAGKAAALVAAGTIQPSQVDEKLLGSLLSSGSSPAASAVGPPDLLIRTSGEQRLSNFLLWDLAYAELYFTPVMWPDFGREDLLAALSEFSARQRRFGRRPQYIQS